MTKETENGHIGGAKSVVHQNDMFRPSIAPEFDRARAPGIANDAGGENNETISILKHGDSNLEEQQSEEIPASRHEPDRVHDIRRPDSPGKSELPAGRERSAQPGGTLSSVDGVGSETPASSGTMGSLGNSGGYGDRHPAADNDRDRKEGAARGDARGGEQSGLVGTLNAALGGRDPLTIEVTAGHALVLTEDFKSPVDPGEFGLVIDDQAFLFSRRQPDPLPANTAWISLQTFSSLAAVLHAGGAVGGKYRDSAEAVTAISLILAGQFDEGKFDNALAEFAQVSRLRLLNSERTPTETNPETKATDAPLAEQELTSQPDGPKNTEGANTAIDESGSAAVAEENSLPLPIVPAGASSGGASNQLANPPTYDYRLKERGGQLYLVPPVGKSFDATIRRDLLEWLRGGGYFANITGEHEISVSETSQSFPLNHIEDGVEVQRIEREIEKELNNAAAEMLAAQVDVNRADDSLVFSVPFGKASVPFSTTGVVPGLLAATLQSHSNSGKKQLHVSSIEVTKLLRNRGLGSKLVREAIGFARENNCDIISVSTGTGNFDEEGLHRFFQRLGLAEQPAGSGMLSLAIASEPEQIAPETKRASITATGPRELDETGRALDGKPLNGGDVFITSSGRLTAPFPKQKREKYFSQWLIDNAVAEAEARGDDFNAPVFRAASILKSGHLTTADTASMQTYLFGEQPPVLQSILRPLSSQQPDDAPETAAEDLPGWGDRRRKVIADSLAAGNQHLNTLSLDTETLRGLNVYYVHDIKVRGVVSAVDAAGNVYIDWADAYSAENELAQPITQNGETIYQSSLGVADLKDYAVANVDPSPTDESEEQQGRVRPSKAPSGDGSVTVIEQQPLPEANPKDVAPAVPEVLAIPGEGQADASPADLEASNETGTEDTPQTASVPDDTGAIDQQSLPADTAKSKVIRDLNINDISAFQSVGKVERYDRNIRALDLLRTLAEEDRDATPSEQMEIALYTGWGALSQELFLGSYEVNVTSNQAWAKRAGHLRGLLTKEEWNSAKDSTVNAHYTSPEIVRAMWAMTRKLGFAGGRAADPAIGLGNFISMMPRDLRQTTTTYGGELDQLTANLVTKVLPDTRIRNIAYQQDVTPDDFYDLVIGNWPFLNMPVADRRHGKLKPVLHDYFFLKALDQTAPNGLVVAVTSAGTMDKRSPAIRREIAKSAELITAIRLPSGAFNGYAGTDVLTDIIILRKREARLSQAPDASWLHTEDFYGDDAGDDEEPLCVKVNRYFLENPRNVLGELNITTHTTYNRPGLGVKAPDDFTAALENAVATLIPEASVAVTPAPSVAQRLKSSKRSVLALEVIDGKPVYLYGDEAVDANEVCKYVVKSESKTKLRADELVSIVAIRKAYDDLREAIAAGDTEGKRAVLRDCYDSHREAFGPLRESFGLRYLKSSKDSAYVRLASLEDKEGNPSMVMYKNTVRQARTIENPSIPEAYIIARQQTVAPSIELLAELCGKPADEVLSFVLDNKMYFKSGDEKYTPSDLFLSGDVRQKLRDLEAAAEAGVTGLEAGTGAIKAIIPPVIPFFNIEARLGARWVPDEEYRAFIADMLKIPVEDKEYAQIAVKGSELGYTIEIGKSLLHRTEARTGFGSTHKPFTSMVRAAIANRTVTIKRTLSDGSTEVDQQATDQVNDCITRMREHFSEWVWKDTERRFRLEGSYNELRNSWVNPVLDGSFMQLEGCSLLRGTEPFNLRKSQLDAAWKGIVNRKGMYNHEVGTGKTYTMGMIAMESAKYGICSKPLLLAHNANSEAVAMEISAMYPLKKILYIDNLDRATKKIKINQIANEHWDLIVLPHSLISSLRLTEETLMGIAQEKIDAIESELEDELSANGMSVDEFDLDDEDSFKKMKSPTAKDLAKARLSVVEMVRKSAISASEEDAIAFEELGIDMILVDEVHEFKKPPIATRMQMKGLNRQVSKRATALDFLATYVRSQNKGGNIHTFSGTMITNTLTELFHQMGFVMRDEMVEAGVESWDSWFNSFADAVTDVELDSAGEYKLTTRLAGFVNLPELSKLVGRYMDTVWSRDMPEMQPRKTPEGRMLTDADITEEEKEFLLNGRTEGAKDRPYIKTINVMADLTVHQEIALARVAEAAKNWANGSGKQRKEWMYSGAIESPIIYEQYANKAGLDTRLLSTGNAGQEGTIDIDKESKVYKLLQNLIQIYESDSLACQAVFTDLGSGQSSTRSVGEGESKAKVKVDTFSTVVDVIERLKKYGIPEAQIAFINGNTSPEKRTDIARRMNSGEIRFVFASTATGGVGVNMQNNLKAMHHLDAPYMPGDLWQRIGRGLRSGNQWNTVLEFRYITASLDARRWQILAIKERFIKAFFSNDGLSRTLESDSLDEDESILKTFSEAAGDPRLLQRIKLGKKVDQLMRRSRVYDENIVMLKYSVSRTQSTIDSLIARMDQNRELDSINTLRNILQSAQNELDIVIDGNRFDGKTKATTAMHEFAGRYSFEIENKARFSVEAGSYQGQPLHLIARYSQPYMRLDVPALKMDFEGGSIVSLDHKIRGAIESIEELPGELEQARRELASLKEEAAKPFPLSDEIAARKMQLKLLEQDIAENPAAPPGWLRSGAPMESYAHFEGNPHVVKGHRYTKDAWLVTICPEGSEEAFDVDYLALKNEVGHPLYGARPFVPPGADSHPVESVRNFAALGYLYQIYKGTFNDKTVAAIAEDESLTAEESKALRSFGMGIRGGEHLSASWKPARDAKAEQLGDTKNVHEYSDLLDECESILDADQSGKTVFDKLVLGGAVERYHAVEFAEKVALEIARLNKDQLARFCFSMCHCFGATVMPKEVSATFREAARAMDTDPATFFSWYNDIEYVPNGRVIRGQFDETVATRYRILENFAGAKFRSGDDSHVVLDNPADRARSVVLSRINGVAYEVSPTLLKVIENVCSAGPAQRSMSAAEAVTQMAELANDALALKRSEHRQEASEVSELSFH